MSEEKEPWLEKRFNKWEVNPSYSQEITVNVGGDQNVMIDKLMGPQCSSIIRVRHDIASCNWIVEEENFNSGEWVERVRFDAQEFYKPEYQKEEET